MHACKGAFRFWRANADKVGAAGCSAGGHLALVLATSGRVAELEGEDGGNLEQSSRVQFRCDPEGRKRRAPLAAQNRFASSSLDPDP